MFFLTFNEVGDVSLIHHQPFDEVEGLKKSEEELNALGLLVEALPQLEQVSGKDAILKVNTETRELYYEYVDKEASRDDVFNNLLLAQRTPKELYRDADKTALDIDKLKGLKMSVLTIDCDNAIYEGFTSGVNRFGYNPNNQSDFTKRLVTIAIGATGPFQWKSLNNGVVELTKEEFIQVVTDAEAHQLAQQKRFWTLEAKVLAAKTNAEVDAINW